ncbi:MAG TPA: LysR substrate-binding domain-containing protein [Candidatus Competibacteraceae bacterium]|nr:LysR substrate-binding domain-containing protein [Candidatus Competibacteraceae bacterium]HRZ05377.1 LysR substrate-binding domain-containing protein [Candidatus Competibacteraceae bacterium]HSA47627.1 LysR substrate-binding domain-containing protein [Candidatus Competibacteraceae bacterium]
MEQFAPNDLLIFARIAEAGSFSRAAERLGLPKSTVSRRMTLFEEQLGERLMLRTTRRLMLTEFGEHLLEHARQVVTEVEAVQALAEHRQARPSGRLRVSMPSDFANLLLTDMLAAFIALHPAVALELDLSPRRVDLLGENFDIAVRMGALPDDTLLAARRIAVFPIGLYAAPTYLAEYGDPVSPEDLVHHEALRLLERNGEAANWTLISGPQRWEGQPAGRTTANSPELLIRLAGAGAGIAAAPDCFAAPSVRRGELRRVLPAWSLPSHPAWAVFPGRRLMPAKTQAFIDMLEAALTGAVGNARQQG